MKKFHIIIIIALIVSACSKDSSGDAGNYSGGQGGSMARFCISGNTLYTVDHFELKLFDITNAEDPVFYDGKTQSLGFGVETIFPMDTLLFIGSQIGMYIYDISKPLFPQKLAFESHITSCDPVVAQGNYAYVTLNSNSTLCGRGNNTLLVYDIQNPKQPQLVKEVDLRSPKGLGIDGDKLFICDKGLKVFDVKDPKNPLWMDDLYSTDVNVEDAYDVIPVNGVLMLVASNGFFQFDYSGDKLNLLSKIEVKP